MGLLQNDSKTKAAILNQQFSSVFTEEDPDNIPQMEGCPYPSMATLNIECEGVHKVLRNLQPHKGTGPDAIPTRLL